MNSTDELPLALEDAPDAANTHLMSQSQFLLAFPELKPPAFTHEFKKKEEIKSERDRYNGERLKRDRPDLYAWVIKALADPRMSYRMITDITGVKHYVLKTIELLEGQAMKSHKKVLSAKYACVSDAAADRMLEVIPRCDSLSQLAMAGGIATDKHMALAGDAIGKIEVHHKIDVTSKIDNAFNEIMDGFNKMKRATVIENADCGVAIADRAEAT